MTYYIDEPIHIVLEIQNKECKVLEILRSLNIDKFKLIDIRSHTKGSISHLLKLEPDHLRKILHSEIIKTKSRSYADTDYGIWIEGEGCNVCNTILSEGAFVISGANPKGDSFIYSFIAPNHDVFQNILHSLKKNGFNPKVLKVMKYRSSGRVLTEKQEIILWIALHSGFFDYPRKVKVEELARRLGISSSTFSEITRRGLRRLLEKYFSE
jgi:predicted DNA binding protein